MQDVLNCIVEKDNISRRLAQELLSQAVSRGAEYDVEVIDGRVAAVVLRVKLAWSATESEESAEDQDVFNQPTDTL
jgi:hypothetical protein